MNYYFYIFPFYKTEEKIKLSKILSPVVPNQNIFRDLLKSIHIVTYQPKLTHFLKNDNFKSLLLKSIN